jgi:hypothetical protein
LEQDQKEKVLEQKQKYKIFIDQKPHEWPEQFITGLQIKKLAGVDQSYGVWQQLPGPDDPEIGDNQKVDVSRPGTEHFFTGKKTTTEGCGRGHSS